MNILIIGLGNLGNHVLKSVVEYKTVNVETYSKGKISNFNRENIKSLDNLENAKQPDVIFITANSYKPQDRFKYLKKHLNMDDWVNLRDDEFGKNYEMLTKIIKGLKHLSPVPVILTANPSEALVQIAHERLKWNSLYGLQIMLDNMRIGRIVGIPKNEYLCIGEHGRPVPTLSHIKDFDNDIYKKINIELSKIVKIAFQNKGAPSFEDMKIILSEIIKAIFENRELRCVLTVSDNGISFGKPFIIKGLIFSEQPIPELSLQEKKLFNETKIRLEKKWKDREHVEM